MTSRQKLRSEEYPLPGTVEGIVALMRQVLKAPGAVESWSVEVGKPVRVMRWADVGDLEEDDPSLSQALQNCEMVELAANYGNSGAVAIVTMLQTLAKNRMYPICWVTGASIGQLNSWVGGSLDITTSLANVPLEHSKSLPAETLVLCGSGFRNGSPGDVTFAVKLTMEMKSNDQSSNQASYRIGDHPIRDIEADGEVGDAGRKRERSKWFAPGFLGRRP